MFSRNEEVHNVKFPGLLIKNVKKIFSKKCNISNDCKLAFAIAKYFHPSLMFLRIMLPSTLMDTLKRESTLRVGPKPYLQILDLDRSGSEYYI
jgi:hypothetical protein